MKKTVFVLIAGLLFGLSIKTAQAQGFDYFAVRVSACEYLKKNPLMADEPLITLVKESLDKFYKKYGNRIDPSDIEMLFGKEGQPGIIDYIYKENNIDSKHKINLFEVAALRFLIFDFLDLKVMPNKEKLIELCFGMLENNTEVIPPDLPFFIYDGFFREIMQLIRETPDHDKRVILLLKLEDLIEKTKDFETLTANDVAKINNLEIEHKDLSFRYMDELSEANISSEEIIKYIINDYLDKESTGSEKNTDEIIETTILTLIQKGKYLSPNDIELLIGRGRLYFYLVQRAEETPEEDKTKRERMAQIIFLDEYIRICGVSYEKDHLYNNRFSYFNTYHGLKESNDWLEQRSLPERYKRHLQNTRIK